MASAMSELNRMLARIEHRDLSLQKQDGVWGVWFDYAGGPDEMFRPVVSAEGNIHRFDKVDSHGSVIRSNSSPIQSLRDFLSSVLCSDFSRRKLFAIRTTPEGNLTEIEVVLKGHSSRIIGRFAYDPSRDALTVSGRPERPVRRRRRQLRDS